LGVVILIKRAPRAISIKAKHKQIGKKLSATGSY